MFIPHRNMSYSRRRSWWNHEIKSLRLEIVFWGKQEFWRYRESFFKGLAKQQLFKKAIYSNKVARSKITSNLRAMQYIILFVVKKAGENSTVFINSYFGLSSYCNLALREKCPYTELFLVHIFPHLYWIRSLFVFSPKAGKYGPERAPYLDTFHAVIVNWILESNTTDGIYYCTLRYKE